MPKQGNLEAFFEARQSNYEEVVPPAEAGSTADR